ncbi:TPA: hypothetical protein ACR3Z0_004218 [Bacillus thuringiensis]|jgi:hypothetical protein|uniref:Uncharacterized protein n=5 Tax=Bacillus cereus group TaxID=86661 RepID=A0A9X6KNM2_BACTU|nr:MULTISPECIES: hypothetical protein [Bacillus]ANN30497.1 hypothetical protein A9498_01790 [Bacillus thuringiensis serovar coreanensis]NIE93731.1 hypothetical protein [Bacillus sp. Ab-1751]CKF26771.1 Uncharacterised protein [Streptococcus pneumoniae]BCA34754.1 hypothetical protein BwiPL1_31360 [Bacillus wiedmannii]AHZ49166.1 hypothetical protein YBT1520_01975 [Bacillus thuringiensis serovar kurstaki str. YBT-1520]
MLLSYLFFSIAVISVIIKYLFIASHYLKYILMIVIICPILSITLVALGKSGTQKIIAIILNSLYFILFSSLALLNLWIIAFGK